MGSLWLRRCIYFSITSFPTYSNFGFPNVQTLNITKFGNFGRTHINRIIYKYMKLEINQYTSKNKDSAIFF